MWRPAWRSTSTSMGVRLNCLFRLTVALQVSGMRLRQVRWDVTPGLRLGRDWRVHQEPRADVSHHRHVQPMTPGEICAQLASMSGAVTGVIAVVGTLLGAVVSYGLQQRIADRNERTALARERRAEHLEVISVCAGALTVFRRAQLDRWHRKNEDPSASQYLVARDEYYRLKAIARQEIFRLRVIVGDGQVVEAATSMFHLIEEVRDATDTTHLNQLADEASHALDEFADACEAYLSRRFSKLDG